MATSSITGLDYVVRSHRKMMRLSQDRLAERLGVSRGWLGRVETGTLRVPVKRIPALAAHLGMDVSALVMSAPPAERKAVETFMRGPLPWLDALLGTARPGRGEMAPDDERHRGRVGAGIAVARKRAKLSQNELAKLARVTLAAVSFAEAGSRTLARDESDRLEMVLRLQPGTLSDTPEQAAARVEAMESASSAAPQARKLRLSRWQVRSCLGKAIEQELEARRLDAKSLSSRTYVSRPRLLAIMGGTIKPQDETVAAIAAGLDMPEADLWSRAEAIAKIGVD